jgi:uncharacterized membrane protein YgcG
MNWIRENKFLTGFIAVMVICAGGLGYLLYTAWSNYNDVSDQYNAEADTLHQLETRVPYPNQENLNKFQSERDDLIDATHTIATTLSQMALPVEDLTPSDFQDRLRAAVSEVKSRANKAGVTIPQNFSLDFEKYETSPPDSGAAGPLGRQLDALQIAIDMMIDDNVQEIASLTRTPLSQESSGGGGGRFGGGGGGGGRFGRGGGGGGGGGGGATTGGLVDKFPFEVHFTASQNSFQKVLNDFAASKKQFFITRTLLVQNTDPKPVSKDAAAEQAAATPTPTPDPNAPAGTPDTSGTTQTINYIVGTEKVDVGLRVDVVAFNAPGLSNRRGGGAGR